MSHGAPTLLVTPNRTFSILTLSWLLIALAAPNLALAQSPGLDDAPVVAPYFNGVFPLASPGAGESQSWTLVNAYPHLTFNDPLVYTPLQGSDRVFVASRSGYIESFVNDPSTTTKELCLDLESITAVVWDGGFLGLSFHPQFGQGQGKDYMFVYHSAREENAPYPTGSTGGFFDSYLRLARYEVDPISLVGDPDSEEILFNIRLYNGSHRGGGLTFGGDGMLYLSIGDQFRYETAQDLVNVFEGGVIRIDVDMDPVNSHAPRRFMGVDVGEEDEMSGNAYLIPNDNPFLDVNGGIFEEFWTIGNRAPHRMTYDAISDRFWSGEVGGGRREEINIISGGNNYGWPFREGLGDGPRSEPDSIGGVLTDPVVDFTRSEARTIIGGYVYRGTKEPSLYGKYICGDYSLNTMWALSYDEGTQVGTLEELTQFTPGLLATFGQDLDGEVYACGLGPDRPIYRLALVTTGGPAPATLSETGFFTDMQSLEVTPAAIPYEINVPFWSDRALKSRWGIYPNDGTLILPEEKIWYDEDGPWQFPEGTVLVKHFEMGMDDTDPSLTKRLETRFIVNGFQGEVYGVTFKWRADGLEADLLMDGLDEDLIITTPTGTRTQTWRYPSPAECLDCHNSATGYALAVTTRQLNRDTTYPSTGRTDNQLATLSSVGLLDETITEPDLSSIPRMFDKSDETVSVDMRARSYLDANCSHCHQPGTGNRATIDARFSTPLEATNIVRGPLIDDLGISGAEVIAPQDQERSMAHLRMLTRDETGIGMPAIATSVADSAGADLIARWIEILDADQSLNVALGKAATQSSTSSGRHAGLAVDGNTDGDYANGSVTQTSNAMHNWWEVDLGDVYDLNYMELYNRTDCCSNRLSDVHIFVSEFPFVSTDPAATIADPNVASFFHPGEVMVSADFDLNVLGRHVRVQLDGTNRLNIAEVQVFSNAWNDTPIEHPVLGNEFAVGGVLDTLRSNLVINRSDAYENTGSDYVHMRVDGFSFHAAGLGDPVTPFVAEMTPIGAFIVRAIGSTRLPQEMQLGPNSFVFDAIEAPVIEVAPGTNLVIGFLDAYPDGSGGGVSPVVSFTEQEGGDVVFWSGGSSGSSSGAVALDSSPQPGMKLETHLERDYHFQMSFTVMQEIPLLAVDVAPGLDRGVAVRLAAPVPNPFNPSTVLRMRLERGSEVDWAVYDLRGRRVVTLMSGPASAGEHVRVWHGEDHQGASVASGVYFQRISVPGEQQANKMVLLK